MSGFFLVLDGADGCGKTELTPRVASRVVDVGRSITLTREAVPSLFAADRLDHVRRVVEPALQQGHVVVCDRYWLSNRVYRMAEAAGPFYTCNVCGWEGEPHDARPLAGSLTPITCPSCLVAPVAFSSAAMSRLEWVRELDCGARAPDLTIVLVASPEAAAERRRRRGGNGEAYDAEAFQARCCAAYARAAEFSPGERVVLVDADAELEAVEQRVWAVVEAELSHAHGVDVGGRCDGMVTTVEDGR